MRNPFSSEQRGRRSHAEAHFVHHHGHHHDHHDDHHRGHRHDHHMMIGRRGHGPFGRGGPEFPGDERGDHRGGGRMGRMFGQGDLKLLLLALIEHQPRHGYELIRAIEELCGGTYSPSPGAIYPTLTYLEEAGYATVQLADASAKKQYAITDEGREHLSQNRPAIEAMMQRLKLSSRMLSKFAVPDAIRECVHLLKHTLIAHDKNWDKAEVERVNAIVKKAIAEITAE